jgi:phosphocarrier protein
MNMNDSVSKQVFIRNELGLHARPAAQIAKEAAKFSAQIKLKIGDMEADAKSVLDILSLAAGRGKSITLHADGQDAEKAIDHLERFFLDGFGES